MGWNELDLMRWNGLEWVGIGWNLLGLVEMYCIRWSSLECICCNEIEFVGMGWN